MLEIAVRVDETPKRLENFLRRRFPVGYVKKLFRKNGVRINTRRAKAGDLVRGGDRIQIYIPFQIENRARASTTRTSKIETIFEDDAVLVVNKAAGVAVHEGRSVSKGDSLLGILEAKYRARGMKPRLVHRLDRDTSGVLIVAKDPETAEQLESCFEAGKVEKQYLGLVVGRLPGNQGKIDLPLPGREGKPVKAVTHYHVLKKFSEATLVQVRIETGRLHQIRLHFAKLGFPVVMDDQHGDFAFNKRFRKEFGLKRQFLHAVKLKIRFDGKLREWTAPLAKDLQSVLDALSDAAR